MPTARPVELLVQMNPEVLESGTASSTKEGDDVVTAPAASARGQNLRGATVAAKSAVVLLLCWVAAGGWGAFCSSPQQPASPGPAPQTLPSPASFQKAVLLLRLSPRTAQ